MTITKKIITSASLLSSDLTDIANEVRRCENAGVDLIHFDVMDGRFVDQITYGAPVLKWVRKATTMPLDVHLMVQDPTKQIDYFAQAGADIITIHAESDCDIPRCLDNIRELGVKASLSLKPNTPAKAALDYIDKCDMILVMTVEPGYGGQSFMEDMMPKVTEIRRYADENGFPELDIQVDGGINPETAAKAIAAGANVLVAGTSLFKAKDMRELNNALKG
ncbi:MAG: ribulose-phosphate 3-epimerase [Oscillospiraceae bacterium]|nr:ribulose-phosphate 3-epimerase [Oscillospiraceae bacterium]